jgi:hypothetical protein
MIGHLLRSELAEVSLAGSVFGQYQYADRFGNAEPIAPGKPDLAELP